MVAWYPGNVDLTSDEAVADLSQYFPHLRVAATTSNSVGLHNQDWGGHVYVCTGLKHPWASMWPTLRHYSWCSDDARPGDEQVGDEGLGTMYKSWEPYSGPQRAKAG